MSRGTGTWSVLGPFRLCQCFLVCPDNFVRDPCLLLPCLSGMYFSLMLHNVSSLLSRPMLPNVFRGNVLQIQVTYHGRHIGCT